MLASRWTRDRRDREIGGGGFDKISDVVNVAKLIRMKQIDYKYTTDSTVNEINWLQTQGSCSMLVKDG